MRRATDWLFRDRRTGKIVVAQFPNLSLGLFVVCRVLGWLGYPHGASGQAVKWAGTAALIWWSADEIWRGANPFRRGVGGVVMTVAVFSLIRN
jgi:hypothetical protein